MDFKIQQKRIYPTILVFLLLVLFRVDSKIFFVLSIALFMYMLKKNRFKLRYPVRLGVVFYTVFAVLCFAIGMSRYEMRDCIRDLFYILPTILWIFIGCNLEFDVDRSLLKTLYVYSVIVSLNAWIMFLLNPAFDFQYLRNIFGEQVYSVGFIMPVMLVQVLILKETVFTKRVDKFVLVLMISQCILSFGRMSILQPLIELFVLCYLLMKINKSATLLSRIFVIIGSLGLVVTIALCFTPDGLINEFMDKFSRIFEEINSSQSYNSYGNAISNWRGYEIYAAKELWESGNLFEQLFGFGLGKGVKINYIPSEFDFVTDSEIPLLHNGFFTILIKCGAIGLLSFLFVYILSIRKGIMLIHGQSDEEIFDGLILTSVVFVSIFLTYVVRGPVQQGVFIIWALLIGYIPAYHKNI